MPTDLRFRLTQPAPSVKAKAIKSRARDDFPKSDYGAVACLHAEMKFITQWNSRDENNFHRRFILSSHPNKLRRLSLVVIYFAI